MILRRLLGTIRDEKALKEFYMSKSRKIVSRGYQPSAKKKVVTEGHQPSPKPPDELVPPPPPRKPAKK